MDRVLVAYGSKYGATAEIADAIGAALKANWLQADVEPARSVRSLEGYRAGSVIVTVSPTRGARSWRDGA